MIDTALETAIDGAIAPKYKGEQCFVIRPNASMSTTCAWVVFLGVFILSIAVMTRFVLIGAWMVVPFTLAEVAFVAYILWMVLRSNKCVETIILNEEELKVIRESHNERKEWIFQPYWARVLLQSGRHAWYPDQLLIQSHGESLEIGMCLTGSERTSLAKVLSDLIPLKQKSLKE